MSDNAIGTPKQIERCLTITREIRANWPVTALIVQIICERVLIEWEEASLPSMRVEEFRPLCELIETCLRCPQDSDGIARLATAAFEFWPSESGEYLFTSAGTQK